jgi:hypothetical protein
MVQMVPWNGKKHLKTFIQNLQCYDEAVSAYTAALEHVTGDGGDVGLAILNNRALVGLLSSSFLRARTF